MRTQAFRATQTGRTAPYECYEALHNESMDHQLEMATSERELLDSIIQQLFGVGLRLEACLRIAEDEQTARTEILDGAISRLGDLVECLRSRIEAMEV